MVIDAYINNWRIKNIIIDGIAILLIFITLFEIISFYDQSTIIRRLFYWFIFMISLLIFFFIFCFRATLHDTIRNKTNKIIALESCLPMKLPLESFFFFFFKLLCNFVFLSCAFLFCYTLWYCCCCKLGNWTPFSKITRPI